MEHAICRVKKYRIMNDIFRNRLRKHDRISDLISGHKLQDSESCLEPEDNHG
ncbi:MAG: hypothetical protein L0H55_09195 [Candidatus Nitrosocosmicus sp.]|nr:hypothetical protein [Candidatus Nitrosocosmicus sp.]